MSEMPLTDRVSQILAECEAEWQQRLQAAEERIGVLEEENASLREKLDERPSSLASVTDEALRQRLGLLTSAPLDTIIREAGVVLESRLRAASGADSTAHGVALVDAALRSGGGSLVFSSHPGEQEGVRMLYRGAMQFIRNPPMHKLIQYPESTAGLLLRLVDALLQLLSEAEPLRPDSVSVEDVRRMLTRIGIPRGQRDLYRALNTAGDEGLSMGELAETIERTRQQVSGVLGALGRRINGTEGLTDKGGVAVVLDVAQDLDGDWHYRMRPVLRQALELEGIL